MSFREKSLWVSLLILVIITGLYGDTFQAILFDSATIDPKSVTSFITRVVIAIVVLEIVLHIVLAMSEQEGANAPEDEREKLFRLKANDIGYWVLSIGVIGCILHKMAIDAFDVQAHMVDPTFVTAPIELKLVVVFLLSEAARFATEIYFYRKES